MLARKQLTRRLEAVWFNDLNGITRQFDLTMAALQPDDSDQEVEQKAEMVANFIDLFIVSRGVANRSYDQQEVDNLVSDLLPEVRMTRKPDELGDTLGRAVPRHGLADFGGMMTLAYREQRNRHFVVYLLARLTSWLENGAGRGDRLATLFRRLEGQRGHEVEHFFPKKPGDNEVTAAAYSKERSRIGAVVLLGGPDNASLGGMALSDKVEPYQLHYLLAASLSSAVYGRGSAEFRNFVEREGIRDLLRPYGGRPMRDFVDERCRLYQAMAERIWKLSRLPISAAKDAPERSERRRKTRTRHTATTADLVVHGFLAANTDLVGSRHGAKYRAVLLADGGIRTASGQVFTAPTPAAEDVLDVSSVNGWTFWRVEDSNESLDFLRTRYEAKLLGQ